MKIADFFKKLLGAKNENNTLVSESIVPIQSSDYPNEYQRVLSFNLKIESLLKTDQYIARSDYRDIISQYNDLPDFFGALSKSGLLSDYVSKHILDIVEIDTFLS